MFRILTSAALSKDVATSEAADAHADAVVWYGHRVTIERRKCVVLMEQSARYGLFFAGMTKPDFKHLGDHLRGRLPLELGFLYGDPALADRFRPAVERLTDPTIIEPGRDRSVQAHINDFVYHARMWADRHGRLPQTPDECFGLGALPNAMLKMGKAFPQGLYSYKAFSEFWRDAAGIPADLASEPIDPLNRVLTHPLPGQNVGTFRLRIELLHLQPAVWRELRVPANLSLGDLHEIIQVAMGWLDFHLHEFIAGQQRFGNPDADWPDRGLRDERECPIDEILRQPGDRLRYVYDLGDDWEHQVTLLAFEPPGAHDERLLCLDGAGECPPEDVGGVPGYMEFLQAFRDRTHPDHVETMRWAGGAFDPNHFDATEVNESLTRSFR